MPFETQEQTLLQESPSGHIFGVQGWTWGEPIPKGITFFIDGSAMVVDQYGRPIRGVVTSDSKQILFAMTPPDADSSFGITPRPQYASHAMVVFALNSEKVGWLLYEVRYATKQGGVRVERNKTLAEALKHQQNLAASGSVSNKQIIIARQVVCAGWPQLCYNDLKKLPIDAIPNTPIEELRRIPDPEMRRDAIRFRTEMESKLDAQPNE